MLVEPTLYKLAFEDGPLKGASVTMASMSIRDTWAYNDALGEITDPDAHYRFIVGKAVSLIHAWDLEKAPGEPWPLTLDGIMSLPDDYMPSIVAGWLKAINGIEDPTGTAEADTAMEATLPMQVLEDEPPGA